MAGWILSVITLAIVAILLRQFLHLDKPDPRPSESNPQLNPERVAIFEPVASEFQTLSSIIGISLNEAIEEHCRGQDVVASDWMRLTESEWSRLGETHRRLFDIETKYMPTVQVRSPIRNLALRHLKCRAMADTARRHELLNQFVLHSKMRYQLHLKELQRELNTLSATFYHLCHTLEPVQEKSATAWAQLDPCFHDYDLLTKEALLSLFTFLRYLPDSELPAIASDLSQVLLRGVRAALVSQPMEVTDTSSRASSRSARR